MRSDDFFFSITVVVVVCWSSSSSRHHIFGCCCFVEKAFSTFQKTAIRSAQIQNPIAWKVYQKDVHYIFGFELEMYIAVRKLKWSPMTINSRKHSSSRVSLAPWFQCSSQMWPKLFTEVISFNFKFTIAHFPLFVASYSSWAREP